MPLLLCVQPVRLGRFDLDKGTLLFSGMDFPCPICGKVFTTKRARANHHRVHTGASKRAGARISATRIATGVARGSNNPNYGEKLRPWLEGESSPLRKWHRENPDFGEKQRGADNPVHKVKHLYNDPEYVATITRGLREHAALKKGSTYEEIYGVEKAEQIKEKLRLASPARLAKFRRKETGPERVIRELLEDNGVPFQQEAPLGYYTVDFLLIGPRVVIQADGDYWHAHPDKYPSPSPRQKDRKRLDASCDSFLRNRGYRVVRLWECDLKADPIKCWGQIEEACGG